MKNSIIFSLAVLVVGFFAITFSPMNLKVILIVSIFVAISLIWIYRQLPKNQEFGKNMILAAGFGITIISWFVSGYINNQQSVLQKKRELKVRMLTDAFFKLQNINDREGTESPVNAYIYYKYSEDALAEIQLLGDLKLIKLAQTFAETKDTGVYNNILIQLRNDLRNELGVPKLSDAELLRPFTFRVLRDRRLKTQDSLTSEDEINLIIRINEEHKDLFK